MWRWLLTTARDESIKTGNHATSRPIIWGFFFFPRCGYAQVPRRIRWPYLVGVETKNKGDMSVFFFCGPRLAPWHFLSNIFQAPLRLSCWPYLLHVFFWCGCDTKCPHLIMRKPSLERNHLLSGQVVAENIAMYQTGWIHFPLVMPPHMSLLSNLLTVAISTRDYNPYFCRTVQYHHQLLITPVNVRGFRPVFN